MSISRRAAILGGAFTAAAFAQTKQTPNEYPDAAPFVTTPLEVAEAMLRLAGVRPDDTVFDLGSGDGRIVVMAAQTFGAKGVGVEIDSDLVKESRDRARRAGMSDKVRFLQEDLFQTDLRTATVVTICCPRRSTGSSPNCSRN